MTSALPSPWKSKTLEPVTDELLSWFVCDHMRRDKFLPGISEWTHGNSLIYVEEDDAYLLMSRTLDTLFKIDRSTGAILWQLGGRHNEFRPSERGILWSHGHLSHVWDGGLLVFDNQVHSGHRSRIVEYAIDEEARTVEQVWEFREPDDAFVLVLGDARRLEGGNTLASWTTSSTLTEIGPDDRIVWRVDGPEDYDLGRVTWIEDLYQGH